MPSSPTCGIHPEEYYLRRQRVAGRLPALYAEEVDRLRHQKRNGWSNVIERYKTEVVPRQQAAARRDMARRLLALAESFDIDPLVLADSDRPTISSNSSSGWKRSPSRIMDRYGSRRLKRVTRTVS